MHESLKYPEVCVRGTLASVLLAVIVQGKQALRGPVERSQEEPSERRGFQGCVHKQLCWALPEGVPGDRAPRPTGTQWDKARC